MINYPLNMPYHLSLMFKLFSPRQVLKKISMIFYYSLLPGKQGGDTLIFSNEEQEIESKLGEKVEEGLNYIHPPMHQQTQLLQTGAPKGNVR